MYHFLEAIIDSATGGTRIGYYARVLNAQTGASAQIFADNNGTPIAAVSGLANAARTDGDGNLSFFIVPGTYHLDLYDTDGETFIRRFSDIPMTSQQGVEGDPGPEGPPGPSNNTRVSLAALKGAATTDLTSLYDGSPWFWTPGDFSGTPAEDIDTRVVESDSAPLVTGAWVRQRADGVQYKVAVAQAVARPVAAFIEDQALSPEEVGAKGDGTSDDTLALQRALATGRNIKLSPGKTYLLKSRLLVDTPNVAFGGGGTIKIAPDWDFASDTDGGGTHMRAIFVEAENVSFDGLIFDLSDAPEGTAVENGVIWSTSPYTSVTNCQFVDNPKGTCIWGLSAWLNVQGNIFKNCSGAAFARGRGPVISNNIIRDAFDAAIAINGPPCIGAAIVGNTIMNDAGRLIPAMIAVEEAASDWTIVGNTLVGANGGGIWCGNVLLSDPADGGVIAGNSIRADLFDGTRPASANPATMIYISPFYINWILDANKVRGLPSGNTDSCLVLVAATGGVVSGNFFDGMGASGIAGHLRVLAGTRGITISNNKSRAPDGRHVLFGPGDYGGVPCTFIGGDFQGGAEAINSELNAASMSNFKLHIQDINAAEGVASVVNAATALGDRATFLNAGAWRFPHRIGVQTVMFGNAMPSNGGAQPFQNGDRVHALTPASGGTLGWVRVPGGTPWVSVGNAA